MAAWNIYPHEMVDFYGKLYVGINVPGNHGSVMFSFSRPHVFEPEQQQGLNRTKFCGVIKKMLTCS